MTAPTPAVPNPGSDAAIARGCLGCGQSFTPPKSRGRIAQRCPPCRHARKLEINRTWHAGMRATLPPAPVVERRSVDYTVRAERELGLTFADVEADRRAIIARATELYEADVASGSFIDPNGSESAGRAA